MENQETIKSTAEKHMQKTKTHNISELPEISVDMAIQDDSFTVDGEEIKQKIIVLEGIKYRVPNSVLNTLKAILEDNPNLKTFKVKKTGEGMDTRYTVIPLS